MQIGNQPRQCLIRSIEGPAGLHAALLQRGKFMSAIVIHMPTSAQQRRRRAHRALWVGQVLLAAFFLMAGYSHAFGAIADIAKSAPWVTDAPVALVRFIGLAELAGAIGLILPAVTRVKPWLTPLAAIGLGLIMVFAIPVHLSRGEAAVVPVNIVIALVATSIAYARARIARISERFFWSNSSYMD
jgi:uncharacterized membrane protein YphA (DoxX/SURF4 family)